MPYIFINVHIQRMAWYLLLEFLAYISWQYRPLLLRNLRWETLYDALVSNYLSEIVLLKKKCLPALQISFILIMTQKICDRWCKPFGFMENSDKVPLIKFCPKLVNQCKNIWGYGKLVNVLSRKPSSTATVDAKNNVNA